MTYLANADDDAVAITVPFTYTLAEYTGTDAWVNSNGTFGSGTSTSTNWSYACPVDHSAPHNALLAFSEDLIQRTGVCVATVGTAPHRQLVVTWSDAGFCCPIASTDHLTFSAILSEGSNIVDVVYQTMMGHAMMGDGNSAAVGITNGTSNQFYSFSCDSPSIMSGTAIRFTPL
jgi:hypothetical protein